MIMELIDRLSAAWGGWPSRDIPSQRPMYSGVLEPQYVNIYGTMGSLFGQGDADANDFSRYGNGAHDPYQRDYIRFSLPALTPVNVPLTMHPHNGAPAMMPSVDSNGYPYVRSYQTRPWLTFHDRLGAARRF